MIIRSLTTGTQKQQTRLITHQVQTHQITPAQGHQFIQQVRAGLTPIKTQPMRTPPNEHPDPRYPRSGPGRLQDAILSILHATNEPLPARTIANQLRITTTSASHALQALKHKGLAQTTGRTNKATWRPT